MVLVGIVAHSNEKDNEILQLLEKSGYSSAILEVDEIGINKPQLLIFNIDDNSKEDIQEIIKITARFRTIPLIVVGSENTHTAVRTIKSGAFDYIPKEFFITSIKHILFFLSALNKNETLNFDDALSNECMNCPLIRDIYGYSDFIGTSSIMKNIYLQIEKVKKSSVSVFIHGESGTGKELVAKAIHNGSPRSSKPFIAINCAAIPEQLLESELFGFEKGAFTGAVTSYKGKLCEAESGTLFLDEIADMPLKLQSKLLRVIEERQFTRIGGSTPIKVDIRIISATNKNLREEVANNNFRDDLFYRLVVYDIDLPPLRKRKEDIMLLVRHFIWKHRDEASANVTDISPDAQNILMFYDWPGNVRELENAITHALVSAEEKVIKDNDLPQYLIDNKISPAGEFQHQKTEKSLASAEKNAIIEALEKSKRNAAKAASMLGIGRATLYRKMKLYKISKQ